VTEALSMLDARPNAPVQESATSQGMISPAI